MSSGFSYDWLEPGAGALATMWSMSPIAHVSQVLCPVLLAISKFLNQEPFLGLSNWKADESG